MVALKSRGEWHRDLGTHTTAVEGGGESTHDPGPFLWICVKERQKKIFSEAAQTARWVRPVGSGRQCILYMTQCSSLASQQSISIPISNITLPQNRLKFVAAIKKHIYTRIRARWLLLLFVFETPSSLQVGVLSVYAHTGARSISDQYKEKHNL